MNVFKLYMRRIFKRKWTLIFMILLPIMFTYTVVAQYNEASKVTLTLYSPDKELNTFVSQMLSKQDVTLTNAATKDEAIHNSTNLGIVVGSSAEQFYQNPDQLMIEMFAKEANFNSKSLEIKLNSVFSSLKTLAKNAPTFEVFKSNMKGAEEVTSPIQVKSDILGNPNAVVLTSAFNMIVFIMMFLTMTNTLLFLSDKVHMTTQRVLLASKSKLSYYLQTVGVFAAIGVVQFILMILFMNYVFQIDTSLTALEQVLLVAAYGLLNVIAAGIGLLLVSQTTRLSTGRLLISVVSLPLAMLGGTLWPSSIMPEGMQNIAKVLPTYWITELNTGMFSGFSQNNNLMMTYFMCLVVCAVVIFFLLTRVKSENI